MQPEVIEKDIYKVELPRVLEKAQLEELQTKIKTWLLEPAKLLVLDFANTRQLSRECIVEFLNLSKTLKKNEKFMASLNIHRSIVQTLKTNGLLQAFGPVASLDEAKKKAGFEVAPKAPKSNKSANAEFLSVFVDSAKKALEVQANTKILKAERNHVRTPDDSLEGDIAIAAFINISSTQFMGCISLCFPKETFLKVYENMVDEKLDEIDDESQDAAGELLNIIYGLAKAVLVNEKGYDLKPAIPNILAGEKLKIQYHSKLPVMVLPFQSEAGKLYVEIILEQIETEENAA